MLSNMRLHKLLFFCLSLDSQLLQMVRHLPKYLM